MRKSQKLVVADLHQFDVGLKVLFRIDNHRADPVHDGEVAVGVAGARDESLFGFGFAKGLAAEQGRQREAVRLHEGVGRGAGVDGEADDHVFFDKRAAVSGFAQNLLAQFSVDGLFQFAALCVERIAQGITAFDRLHLLVDQLPPHDHWQAVDLNGALPQFGEGRVYFEEVRRGFGERRLFARQSWRLDAVREGDEVNNAGVNGGWQR